LKRNFLNNAMQHDFKNNIQNIRVGIFKTKNTYRAEILSATPLSNWRGGGGEEEVIHIRTFSEMILALGYRDVMNKLSKKSIENIITTNKGACPLVAPSAPLPCGEWLGERSEQ
jgi:hypothetical protein